MSVPNIRSATGTAESVLIVPSLMTLGLYMNQINSTWTTCMQTPAGLQP